MAANTIALKTNGHHDEGACGAATSPGMAVELQADGKYDPMVSAQAAALKRGLQIVKEDALQGKTTAAAYAVDDRLFFFTALPGDHINALVKSGEDIDIGDKLVVVGGSNGRFEEAAGTETKYQLEPLQDSGGALAADTTLACRVI